MGLKLSVREEVRAGGAKDRRSKGREERSDDHILHKLHHYKTSNLLLITSLLTAAASHFQGKWTNSTPSWRSNLPPLPPHPDALEAERCFHEALTYCPSNYHVLASYLRYLTVHHPEHRTEEYMSRIYSSILKHDPSNQHGPLIWSRYLLLSKNSPPSALAVLHNATLHPTASSAVLQDYFSLTLTQKPEMIPELFSSNLPRVRGKDYVEFVLLYVRYCYAMGKSLEAEEWLDKAEQVEGKLGTDWCGVERRKRGPRTPSQVVKSSQGLMARLGEVELDDVVHDSSLLISWAKVKEHDGNVEDAVDILEVARGRFPTDVGVWLSLGRIWEKKDKEKGELEGGGEKRSESK